MVQRFAGFVFCLMGVVGAAGIVNRDTAQEKEAAAATIGITDTAPSPTSTFQTEVLGALPLHADRPGTNQPALICLGLIALGVYFWGQASATAAIKDLARAVRSKSGLFS